MLDKKTRAYYSLKKEESNNYIFYTVNMLYQAKLKEDKGLVKVFECILSGFEIGKIVETKLQELQQNAHLKGFRKGKAPMKVIQEGYFGKTYFDAVNKEANSIIFKIAEENNFQLASSPKIELDAESSLPADRNTANIKDITINITYETFPSLPSFDFSKITIEKISLNVTESDIQEELTKIAQNTSTNKQKEGDCTVEDKDVAIIDFIGYESGVAFAGGTATDFNLEIGSKSFIEGFEEGLIGLKKGENKTLSLKFPEQYHAENLAGKAVEFNVTIKDIMTKIPADINDELAKKYGFETLEHLKNDIKKSITANYENVFKSRKKEEVFNKIKDTLDFEVPPSVIARISENKNETDSIKDARLSVFLMQYAKQNEVNVTKEDFANYVESIARMYGQSPQALFAFYNKNEQMRESTMNSIFENKIYESIYDSIPCESKSINKNDFDELLKEMTPNPQD